MQQDKDILSITKSIEQQLDIFFKMHKEHFPGTGLSQSVMHEVEKVLIQKTINYTEKVQLKAAKILGINRNTLRKKIKDLKIE